jgi:hypothetical protein
MPYGSGSIYTRGRIFWISYMVRGEQVNESSKSRTRKDADTLLKKRMGEIESGRVVGSTTLTVPDLLDRLQAHYIENERRSIGDLKGKIAALKEKFRGVRASEFGTGHISRLKASMKRDGAANATVNRYLATLRRAFRLAAQHDPPLVGRVPHFELLPEDNARSGFLTDEPYRTVREWLPEHVKGLFIFGYHLGMRKTALKNLRRDQVDWPNRVIRAEAPRGAKKQGRALPIYGDMEPWLEMQMATWFQTRSAAGFSTTTARTSETSGSPGPRRAERQRFPICFFMICGVPRFATWSEPGFHALKQWLSRDTRRNQSTSGMRLCPSRM